jgi:hypothetical protein
MMQGKSDLSYYFMAPRLRLRTVRPFAVGQLPSIDSTGVSISRCVQRPRAFIIRKKPAISAADADIGEPSPSRQYYSFRHRNTIWYHEFVFLEVWKAPYEHYSQSRDLKAVKHNRSISNGISKEDGRVDFWACIPVL